MSEKPDRPAVPAWQQANQSAQAEKSSSTTSTDGKDASNDTEVIATSPDLAAAEPLAPLKSADDPKAQREQIRAFLLDPTVKDQSTEKKRTFLEGKKMPTYLINEELDTSSKSSLDVADFAGFRTQAIPQEHSEIQQQTPRAPPIITYPEFLANAHSAPPLITPTRILATTYVASAAAALAYAASTFLIKPMTASLTDSRHEFAMHSVHQVDDFNSRLEKLVSQIPDTKSDGKEEDNDSVASEPTELFSRDQGTQTTQGTAQATDHASKVTIFEPTVTTKQAEKLNNLQKHLEAILAGTQKEGKAVEEREEGVKKLRQYLDSLSYGSSGINVWSNSGGQFGWEQNEQQKEKEKKEDAIEDLKKEIRGVKGVLLSAKRFPAVGRAPNSPAPQYSSWRGVDAPV